VSYPKPSRCPDYSCLPRAAQIWPLSFFLLQEDRVTFRGAAGHLKLRIGFRLLSFPQSAVVSGLLYVIGGYEGTSQTPSNLVQIYNPTTNAWTTGATTPNARGSVAAVVDGTSIYIIGGNGLTDRLTTVEKDVPSTNTWTEEAALLSGVSELSAGLLGSTIVAADGSRRPETWARPRATRYPRMPGGHWHPTQILETPVVSEWCQDSCM
jgi:hypothetical protein